VIATERLIATSKNYMHLRHNLLKHVKHCQSAGHDSLGDQTTKQIAVRCSVITKEARPTQSLLIAELMRSY